MCRGEHEITLDGSLKINFVLEHWLHLPGLHKKAEFRYTTCCTRVYPLTSSMFVVLLYLPLEGYSLSQELRL
jgi:hypothetical protein